MTTTILTNHDSVLETVGQLIAEDNLDTAVRHIIAIKGVESQLNVVFTLIHSLTRALDTALERARKNTQNRELARDLSLVRALTRALDRDLARARARAFYLARSLARDPVRTRAIYNALELDLVLVRALSLDLDLGLVRKSVLENDPDAMALIHREHNTVKVIVEVLEYEPTDDPEQFVLVGLPFTPANLGQHAAPFLEALTGLQKIVADMRRREFVEPQIMMMSASSFEIQTVGLGDAIYTSRKILQNYKRKLESNAQAFIEERAALQSEKDGLDAQLWMLEDEVERNPKLTVQTKEMRLAELRKNIRFYEKELIERDQLLREREYKYYKAQMYSYRILANAFIDVIAPMLNVGQRTPFIPRLIKEFKVIADSPLQLQL